MEAAAKNLTPVCLGIKTYLFIYLVILT